MNNKFNTLQKNSAILLATVPVAGVIGISSPFAVFAQVYEDEYEREYDSYDGYKPEMNSDKSKPIIQIANCDNSIVLENTVSPQISTNIQPSAATNGISLPDESKTSSDSLPPQLLEEEKGLLSEELLQNQANIVNICFNVPILQYNTAVVSQAAGGNLDASATISQSNQAQISNNVGVTNTQTNEE